tara:strand:+ start:509 stop:973 length:465 start_codon:yes stop_codon:yes gene_type:complete
MQRAQSIGKSVLMVNHARDTRVASNKVGTHANLLVDAIHVKSINELSGHLKQKAYDAIFIDESQFFEDLLSVESLVHTYDVTLAGLVSDFQQNIFGSMHKLLCKADDVQFMRALCAVCCDGTPASFSKRKTGGTQQVQVGASEYLAVCRMHLNP